MGVVQQWLQASITRRVVWPTLLVVIAAFLISFSVVRQVSLHELQEVLTSNLSTSAKSMFGVLRSEFPRKDTSVLQGLVDRYSARWIRPTSATRTCNYTYLV